MVPDCGEKLKKCWEIKYNTKVKVKKMKKFKIFSMILTIFLLAGCAELSEFGEMIPSTTFRNGRLTREEIIRGLKEALVIGAKNSVSSVSTLDGFYGNPQIYIPFPPEAIKVKNTLEQAGFTDLVSDFEKSINRAAEKASEKAFPIFKKAVTGMTIMDAMGILKGSDDAATMYLKSKTEADLREEFTPIVQNAIEQVEVTSYWNPIATVYNRIVALTGGTRVNPNLDEYITQNALDGLFHIIAREEKKIRKNPAARVTYLLQRVFGAQ